MFKNMPFLFKSKFQKFLWFLRLALAFVLVIGITCLLTYTVSTSKGKTTKLGFENIGELATQASRCTEVGVIDDSKKIFGLKIPFTQSTYIYSYDFIIKAGFDFSEIQWSEKDGKITVHLPEVTILSCETVSDSFQVFYEKESAFRHVKLEETLDSIEELKEQAKADSIENGLYDNAKTNAEAMLTAFFGSAYDMDAYEISFVYD